MKINELLLCKEWSKIRKKAAQPGLSYLLKFVNACICPILALGQLIKSRPDGWACAAIGLIKRGELIARMPVKQLPDKA
ncbi:hypothetical protein [Spirosoma aerophilum]